MAGTWLSCPHCLLFFLHPEHTPQPSQCPGCAQLLPPPAEDPDDLEWFYIENRQKLGPVKLSRLQELAASGQLPPDGMVLEKGTSKWAVAADVPGLFAEALAVAPEATPYEEPAPTPVATVYEEPAPPPPPAVPATPRKFLPRWFYQDGGQQVGPVGFARLRELADAGQLQPHTVLLQQGADEWEPASRIDGLFPAEPPAPPPATPPVAVMPTVEPTPAAPGWFYVEHKRKVGPVGLERLQELIDAGQLSASDMVLPQGSAQWVALQALPELAPLFAVADAPAPVVEPEPVVEPVAPAPLAITEEPTVAAAIVEEVPEEPPIESVAVAVIEEVPAPVVEPPVAVALSVESAPATPIEEPEPVAVAISVEPPPAVNGQPVPAAVAVTPPIAAPPVVESAPTVPAIDPDELVRSFESAWLQGKYPELEAYLPATDELRRAVAPRLACIDLQCRLNCKEAVRVETYLERFPALAENRPGVLDLLALEFRLRRRGQSDLTTEEYSQRFPQYGDELRQRLEPPAPSRPVPRPSEPEAAPAAASFPSIPDHEILGIHGESARAVVYRARHCKLNRPVALKLLAGPPGDPVQRQKLFAEARAAARVHHPHIVEVYEVGEHAGRLYCSLEWLDGEPLARRLTGAPLPVREAVELTVHLTDALQAAHTQDVFHGQLHPSNVLLDAGSNHRPKLINLGMRPCGGDLRGAEAVLAGYRAPEQAEGRIADIGPLSDMHALGVLLFELLTGRPPFRGETVEETLRQVRSQEPSAPSELNDRIPADLDAICLKCLQKEPTRRYTSAEELAADLKRFQSGQRPRARAALHLQPAVRFARRYPLTAAILAGLLLLNFVAFATTYAKYRDAERRLALAATDHSQVGQTAEAAQQQAAQAEARRAQAEQALNEARAAEQKLRTEWQQVQTREKQAREDAQKAQEQTKLARQDEAAAREEAKKAQDAATQARLALTQAAPAADRQLAEHWEKAGQWTAAAYHLSRLIESQPQDEKLLLRRADARRRLEQWLPAASDYARALELKPDSGCADLRDRCLLRSGPVQAAAVVGLLAGPWPTVILYDPSIP